MQKLTLTISDIGQLNSIKKNLSEQLPLTVEEQAYLSKFLSRLPTKDRLLGDGVPFDEAIIVNVWNMDRLEATLDKWQKLFGNLPGYDYVSCWLVENEDKDLLNQNVIMTACYAPSMSYNYSHLDGYHIHLKDDGTAKFWFPTFEDAEQYPELYNFKGTWKEAYLLLIETLKKGWPMEEFPKELQQFLKK